MCGLLEGCEIYSPSRGDLVTATFLTLGGAVSPSHEMANRLDRHGLNTINIHSNVNSTLKTMYLVKLVGY